MKSSKKINKIEFFQNDENNEKLIRLICERPPLYDYKMPVKERSKNYKNELWQEVSYSLGASVDDCKNRWKNLRDTYQLYRHKCINNRTLAKWKFAELLSFLEDIHTYRSSLKRKKIRKISPQEVIISVPGIPDPLDEIDMKKQVHGLVDDGHDSYIVEDYQCTEETNAERNIEIKTINSEDFYGETEMLEFENEKFIETEDISNPFPEEQARSINKKLTIVKRENDISNLDELDFFMEFLKKKIRKLKPEHVTDIQMKFIQIIFQKEKDFPNHDL